MDQLCKLRFILIFNNCLQDIPILYRFEQTSFFFSSILIKKMLLFPSRVLVPSNRRLIIIGDFYFQWIFSFSFPLLRAEEINEAKASSRVTGRKVGIRFGSETFRLPLLLASLERSSTGRGENSPTTLELRILRKKKMGTRSRRVHSCLNSRNYRVWHVAKSNRYPAD